MKDQIEPQHIHQTAKKLNTNTIYCSNVFTRNASQPNTSTLSRFQQSLSFEYIVYSAIKSISFHQLIIKRKRDKHHDNHCNVHNILASDIKYK